MRRKVTVFAQLYNLTWSLNIVCAVSFLFLVVNIITPTNGIEDKGSQKPKVIKTCTSKPELKLRTSKFDLKSVNGIYNPEKSEIFVPEKITLSLECISSKPIDFDFEGYLTHTLSSVETTRILSNYSGETQEECYSILVKFETSREATGFYRCWNINEKATTNTSIYVYANGEPYLLYGDAAKDIIEISIDPNDDFVILPCATTNPKIPVALYQIERQSFKLLSLGEHLSYDPKFGFRLNLKKFPDPFTKYKCVSSVTKSRLNADVFFHLKEDENGKKVRLSTTEIFEDHTRSSHSAFVCSGSTGLAITSTSDCQTLIQCRLAEKCMKEETACSQPPCRCSHHGHSCSKNLKRNFFNSDKFLGDECVSISKNENGGIIHCSSSKYEEGQTISYFTGINGNIVQNWKHAHLEEILNVTTTLGGNDDRYLVGEVVSFTCTGSKTVFSRGFQWKIQLKNGSMISANALEIKNHKRGVSWIVEEAMIKISLPEIHSVICLAPVWNETSWIKTILPLKIQDTVAPSFFEPENITVSFYLNDKNQTIVCEAKGYPQPDILWLKGGEPFLTDFRFDNSIENVTKAILNFQEITETDHDSVYTCNASNPRGMAFKTFTIYVRALPSTWIYPVAGVALLICFAIVIIVSFVTLKRIQNKKLSGYIFHFSDFDMEEFRNGNPTEMMRCSNVCEKALYLPYDEAKYEISEENLSIDFDNMLGQGNFGVVLQGNLTQNDSTFPVAVKTVKTTEMSNLKALLSELKIMMFIGSDCQYIVKLIGAVTKNVMERHAMVVVEYCALGSLENYLKEHRTTFLDEFQVSSVAQSPISSYVQIQYLVKTTNLINWGYEIATGMEYLARKKIVHGDLALRNLLLSQNQNIKITDFGLSKQLYKCTSNYVTKIRENPTAVPWRHLAPESLRDLEFSAKSDVWAFGVTLWELFSLAETPYPGIGFNREFLVQLGNGFRLDKPRFSNIELYSIMRECWRQEAEDRPTFTILRRQLAHMLPSEPIDYDSDYDIVSQNTTNHLKEELLPNSSDVHRSVRV